MSTGYALVAGTYYERGWSPLPLPKGAKTAPPTGTTGATGKWPTRDDLEAWAAANPDGNVGLRLPEGVIGIDVDDYDGKGGGATIAELEATYGKLPPTWTSTSRGLGVSGIRLYRVPAGVVFPGILGPGIDVIQHHHRYLVAAPSVHPSGGSYRWYDQHGNKVRGPSVCDLPELPESWLALQLSNEPEPPAPPRLRLVEDDDSIAERINRDHNWHDVLTADGWVLTETLNSETRWRRPGKTTGRTSAVLHEPDGPLVVFTTSVAALQQPTATKNGDHWSYSLFGYIAATRYNGDRSACASDYRKQLNAAAAYDHTISSAPIAQAALEEPEPADPNEPWPEPIPLGEAERVARFPVEVLPDWMQPIVNEIADDLQAEPDLPAVLGLVALSVACAGSRHVIVRNVWREPLNIYCAVALPPSSGKSPAFKHMMAPIRAYEKAEAERTGAQVEHVAQKRRIIEKAMKRAEDKGDITEAQMQLDLLLTTPEVHPFRLTIDDATPEALVIKLSEHNGRLALLSSEGGPFEMMGGRYSDTANLDPYLKPWGEETISVDRVGRGSISVDRPTLTIGLTVQPTVIASLADNPAMIGKGLTARFMYSVPPTNNGNRDMFYEGDISEPTRQIYNESLTWLLEHELDKPNADLPIDADALAEYHGWRQGLEAQRGPTGALHIVSEWTTKLESTVARVAGLFALGDAVEHIDIHTMRRAIAVGNYWLSHIRAVLDLWGRDDTVTKARQVVAWYTVRELSDFSVRDLYGALRRLFPTADDTRPVLNLLTERGWIRPLFEGPLVLGRRGVDSPRFAVRPSSLGISASHARHARHVPKHEFRENSLTHSESEQGTPLAHDTHDAHDHPDRPDTTPAAATTTSGDEHDW